MRTNDVVALEVNGEPTGLSGDRGVPLLVALREQLRLHAVRPGCTVGECGACTVLIDGVPTASCQTTVGEVAGRSITTPEGLSGSDGDHPVLDAFLELEAAQCGYCVNGIMMRVAGLAASSDRPTDISSLAVALDGQLCRCGTHVRLLEAAARVLLDGSATTALGDCEIRSCDTCIRSDGEGRVPDDSADDTLPELIERSSDVSQWLRITPTGRVEVLSGRVEIGQAVHTALRQVVASHLQLDPSLVDIVPPSTAHSRNEGFTAGSKSVMDGGGALARAATAMRRLILERAGERLSVPVDALKLSAEGEILGVDSVTLSIADLADVPIRGPIELHDRPDWTLSGLGAAERRRDLETKLRGAAFIHDIVEPGMLHARAVLPPSDRAILVSTDVEGIRALEGVVEVVHDGRLLIVIAERESVALRAAAALESRTRWDEPVLALDGSVLATMRGQASEPYIARDDEGIEDALDQGVRVRASYSRPYQSHGSVTPSAGLARVQDGALEVWSHSQGIFALRKELSVLLDGQVETITVNHAEGAGAYGHNGADDAAALAAVAALAVPGRLVRIHLSVSDEFHWEPYGSAMASDLEASIVDGRVAGWRHRTLTDGHMNRPSGQGDRTLVAWLREGGPRRSTPPVSEGGARNIVPLYAFPRMHCVADHTSGPLRSGSLRSLGSFQNIFAHESFMDELAEVAGQDPLAFRLAQLEDPRAAAVLTAAAEAAGWEPHVGPSGRGLGIAVGRYHDEMGFAAVVAEVQVDIDADLLAVRRLVIASDLGTIVNPEGARQQLEGGALQGISRTMHEALRVERRGVTTDSWETYPVLRFSDVPRIDVILLDRRGAPPLGAGEVTTPVVPAAIANAIDDATGIRMRDLPITIGAIRERVLGMEERELARIILG